MEDECNFDSFNDIKIEEIIQDSDDNNQKNILDAEKILNEGIINSI